MNRKPQRPHFLPNEAAGLAKQFYCLRAEASELPSERDQNFQLTDDAGKHYVLKIANAAEERATLDLQNDALACLAKSTSNVSFPKVLNNTANQLISSIEFNGRRHFVRLLTFLPGKPLAEVRPHSVELLRAVGCFLGQLTQSLQGFSHAAAKRELHWDLKKADEIILAHRHLIADADKARLVEHFLDLFQTNILPELPTLRTSVIHNDANDYNVIVKQESSRDYRIGLIDFGDMVHSCTLFELAIACAYVVLHKPNPLASAAEVIAGFHTIFPLTEPEIELLFALICARLIVSVCVGAFQRQKDPDNEYLSISEQPAWEALQRLADICPRFAHYVFRQACGLAPNPKTQAVVEFLTEARQTIGPVVPLDLTGAPNIVFDLSVGSLELQTPDELANMQALSQQLFERMASADVEVGVGRYDEARLCYQGQQFQCGEDETCERRTVHIGMDLFMPAGTAVLAPLDGKIHSFRNNAMPLDYGPTIILEHEVAGQDLKFFTLYGHLSLGSLAGLNEGATVKKRDEIARLGDISVNGGWPPHLHFQLITDMLDLKGDFPGVALPSERDAWLSMCPNPNIILRIPENDFPKPKKSREDLLRIRWQRLSKSLSVSYRQPLEIVRGYMQYLYDENGRRYLDAVNNVPHVGHSHPKVVDALQRQAAVLNTNTRYLHDHIVKYAERLCATMPEPLNVCFFVNSGSEANELALRLARTHTGQIDTIVVDGAYHGNTGALIDISSYKFDAPGGAGAPGHVHKVPMPDTYRGPYKLTDPRAGQKYANYVAVAIDEIEKKNRKLSVFICESLLGCAGQIVPPESYFEAAFEMVRKAGGVCILDEVQVGFGRVGSHFWGFETQGVVPDIVTLGKPIGNGHPIGAVVTTPEIAESFHNGMEYFNTFGGNPVSCAVGLAVLDVLEEERLQQNSFTVGAYLKQALENLQEKHPLIGDVRGLGLFLGVELVSDRETLEPAAEQATYAAERMKDCGILISTDGPLHNVLKVKPPMVFSRENADRFVAALDQILREDFVLTKRT